MDILKKEELEKVLKPWGTYKLDENCLYLLNNSSLKDEELLNLVKNNQVKIQLTLFI